VPSTLGLRLVSTPEPTRRPGPDSYLHGVSDRGYLLNFVLLVLVLRNGLGRRRLTVLRQVLPLVLALFLGFAYAGLHPAGDAREIAGAVAGVICGVVAAALLRVRRSADGSVITSGGYGYAALWSAVIGGRCVLAGWLPGLGTTFVLMTLTMLVTRVVVTFTVARRSVLSQ
jgi:hypothetical protein